MPVLLSLIDAAEIEASIYKYKPEAADWVFVKTDTALGCLLYVAQNTRAKFYDFRIVCNETGNILFNNHIHETNAKTNANSCATPRRIT